MNFAFILLCIALTNQAETQIEETLQKIRSTDLGKSLLKNVETKIKGNDPLDRIISVMENMKDSYERELEKLPNTEECDQLIDELQGQIRELNEKLRDLNGFEKQAMLDDTLQRFKSKNETFSQMKTDIDKLIKRNQQQVEGYGQVDDNLEQAIEEMKWIKERFAMALEVRDDDDDDESAYYHLFLKTSVSIRKSKERLKSMVGLQLMFTGFEEVCELLHGSRPQEDVVQLVVDICSELIDWMYGLRDMESEMIQEKSNLNKKLVNTIQDQIDQTQVELQASEQEMKELKYEIELLEQKREFTESRLGQKEEELSDLEKSCSDKRYDLSREKERVYAELATVSQLLELIEFRGGQLRKLLAG